MFAKTMIVDIVDIIKILIGGLCVGLASSVTVGPVAVLCIQRTLSRGYFSGIFSGLGVATADTLMAILSFTLYALLKEYIDRYNTVIMICGGIFVIIVGIFIFFKNPVPQVRKNRTGTNALWQDFASMFGFTLANFAIIIPYILAFFTMFNIDLSSATETEPERIEAVKGDIAADVDAEFDYMVESAALEVADASIELPTMVRNILILLGFLIGAMIWWACLTSLINLFRRNFKPRHLIMINRIAGIIISALGSYTLLSVIINL